MDRGHAIALLREPFAHDIEQCGVIVGDKNALAGKNKLRVFLFASETLQPVAFYGLFRNGNKIRGPDGFFEISVYSHHVKFVFCRLGAVAGRYDCFEPGFFFVHLGHQLHAVHFGHHDVGNQQVVVVFIQFDKRRCPAGHSNRMEPPD